jgi:hypothetical protein
MYKHSFVFVVALVSLPHVASAQESAPASSAETSKKKSTTTTTKADLEAAPPSPDKVEDDSNARNLRGLELMLRPGFGGAPAGSPVRYVPAKNVTLQDAGSLVSGTASPWSAGFVGQASLGYRFHPVVSAGLRAGMRNASGENLADGSTNLARKSWDAGFYARGYPLAMSPSIRKHIDPWFGVGIGYMRDTQTFNRSVATPAGQMPADFSIDHHAVAVPLSIGVDYRVLPQVSIGPSFEYTIASAVAGCLKAVPKGPNAIENSYCSNEGIGKSFIKAETYGVWTAGLDLRATLF